MLTTWTPAHMPEKEEIKIRLQTARSQLYDFQMKIKEHKIPVIVLFEGWGSSGKGSTIGKVIKNIDPRFFKVATMSAPTAEELRYPFLYRYFKQIPEAGKFTFLDSGWMEQTCKDFLSGEIEGEGYTQPVTYWMPFNGGIGFHDATWQAYFGGDRYTYAGSHGCINMPLDAAATLYSIIDTNVPIVCFY